MIVDTNNERILSFTISKPPLFFDVVNLIYLYRWKEHTRYLFNFLEHNVIPSQKYKLQTVNVREVLLYTYVLKKRLHRKCHHKKNSRAKKPSKKLPSKNPQHRKRYSKNSTEYFSIFKCWWIFLWLCCF